MRELSKTRNLDGQGPKLVPSLLGPESERPAVEATLSRETTLCLPPSLVVRKTQENGLRSLGFDAAKNEAHHKFSVEVIEGYLVATAQAVAQDLCSSTSTNIKNTFNLTEHISLEGLEKYLLSKQIPSDISDRTKEIFEKETDCTKGSTIQKVFSKGYGASVQNKKVGFYETETEMTAKLSLWSKEFAHIPKEPLLARQKTFRITPEMTNFEANTQASAHKEVAEIISSLPKVWGDALTRGYKFSAIEVYSPERPTLVESGIRFFGNSDKEFDKRNYARKEQFLKLLVDQMNDSGIEAKIVRRFNYQYSGRDGGGPLSQNFLVFGMPTDTLVTKPELGMNPELSQPLDSAIQQARKLQQLVQQKTPALKTIAQGFILEYLKEVAKPLSDNKTVLNNLEFNPENPAEVSPDLQMTTWIEKKINEQSLDPLGKRMLLGMFSNKRELTTYRHSVFFPSKAETMYRAANVPFEFTAPKGSLSEIWQEALDSAKISYTKNPKTNELSIDLRPLLSKEQQAELDERQSQTGIARNMNNQEASERASVYEQVEKLLESELGILMLAAAANGEFSVDIPLSNEVISRKSRLKIWNKEDQIPLVKYPFKFNDYRRLATEVVRQGLIAEIVVKRTGTEKGVFLRVDLPTQTKSV